MATSESSLQYPGWRVVAASFCGVMVSFGSLFVFTFGVFLKPLAAEFGWTREMISSGFGVAAMSVALASPVLGRLLDRHGSRGVVLICMAVFAACVAALSGLSGSPWHFFALCCAIGLVGNGTTQMGYARAVAGWFSARRGLALALVMAGTGAGSIVLPPLAEWLIRHYGWRMAYLALGAMILALGLPLTAAWVRDRPGAGLAAGIAHGASVREGLQSRPFWLLTGALFLSSIALNGAITHLPPLLTDRGVDSGQAALALSVLGMASLAGRVVTGHLLDRFPGPRVAVLMLALAAAGVLGLSQARTASAGLAAAALIGWGMGAEADVTPYLLCRFFGLRSFSTLYGLTWTAYAIAGATGPVLMGRAFDATRSYEGLLGVMAALTLAAAALMGMLPGRPSAETLRGSGEPLPRSLPS